MDDKQIGSRTCPECGSEKYLFRGRKKIPTNDGKAEEIETTYRCKECEHTWKERIPIKQQA